MPDALRLWGGVSLDIIMVQIVKISVKINSLSGFGVTGLWYISLAKLVQAEN